MSLTNSIRKLFYKIKGVERDSNFLGYGINQHGILMPIYQSEKRHKSLNEDQMDRIKKLAEVLFEAYPLSIEEWVDGFLRDSNPEKELQIIESIAWAYRNIIDGMNLSNNEKKEIYSTLCYFSSCKTYPKDVNTSALRRIGGIPEPSILFKICKEAISDEKRI